MRPRTLAEDQESSAKAAGARLDERYARFRFTHPELRLPPRSKITDLERNLLLVSNRIPTTPRTDNSGPPLKQHRCTEGLDRQRARCYEGAAT